MNKQRQLRFRGDLVRLSDGARLSVGGIGDSTGARILSSDVIRFCEVLWWPPASREWEPREPLYDPRRPAGFVFEPDGRFFWDDVSLPGVGFVRCRNRSVSLGCVSRNNPQPTTHTKKP